LPGLPVTDPNFGRAVPCPSCQATSRPDSLLINTTGEIVHWPKTVQLNIPSTLRLVNSTPSVSIYEPPPNLVINPVHADKYGCIGTHNQQLVFTPHTDRFVMTPNGPHLDVVASSINRGTVVIAGPPLPTFTIDPLHQTVVLDNGRSRVSIEELRRQSDQKLQGEN
jgi:hypothetical protein